MFRKPPPGSKGLWARTDTSLKLSEAPGYFCRSAALPLELCRNVLTPPSPTISSTSQGLTIMSRHQQPHHTLSFLACLHEICNGASIEAATTAEEAAAVAKQLSAQHALRISRRRALKLALHAAQKQKLARQTHGNNTDSKRTAQTSNATGSTQASEESNTNSSSSSSTAGQHSAALKYFSERAARKKQQQEAVAAAAAASIPGTQPTDQLPDSDSGSELDSDCESEEADTSPAAPSPTQSGAAAGASEAVGDFTIPPQVVVSVEQKAAMDERFRRLHGAALVASSVADASAPLLMAPVLQVRQNRRGVISSW